MAVQKLEGQEKTDGTQNGGPPERRFRTAFMTEGRAISLFCVLGDHRFVKILPAFAFERCSLHYHLVSAGNYCKGL